MNMKLDTLRRSATDARDAAHAAQQQLADLEAQLHSAQRMCGFLRVELDPRVAALQHQVELARTRAVDAQALADSEAAVLDQAGRLVNHPYLRFEEVDQPEVEHDLEKLASTREQIGDLKSQIDQLDRSPPSRQETLAGLRSQVRNMAEAPSLNEHGRLVLPTNAAAMQAWLDPDRLVEALARTLPIPDGLAQEAKDEQRPFLSSTLLELERQEESLVEAARAEGVMVPRRPDADPRAVLGVTRAQPEEEDQAA